MSIRGEFRRVNLFLLGLFLSLSSANAGIQEDFATYVASNAWHGGNAAQLEAGVRKLQSLMLAPHSGYAVIQRNIGGNNVHKGYRISQAARKAIFALPANVMGVYQRIYGEGNIAATNKTLTQLFADNYITVTNTATRIDNARFRARTGNARTQAIAARLAAKNLCVSYTPTRAGWNVCRQLLRNFVGSYNGLLAQLQTQTNLAAAARRTLSEEAASDLRYAAEVLAAMEPMFHQTGYGVLGSQAHRVLAGTHIVRRQYLDPMLPMLTALYSTATITSRSGLGFPYSRMKFELYTPDPGALDNAVVEINNTHTAERPWTLTSTLGSASPLQSYRVSSGQRMAEHIHYFRLPAGKRLTVTMASQVIDSYIGLFRIGTTGDAVVFNDDGFSRGLNSRFNYNVTTAGVYALVATTYEPGRGGYTLSASLANPNPGN